jgi:methionyl-tRNA formyltransferase
MKIGYFADGPWSYNSFFKIYNDVNFDVSFICVRFDSEDETLKEICKEYNIPYLKHKNVNSSEFLENLKKYECDIFVSMSFNQIFKSEIINLCSGGFINCHAGKLPFYRGRNILNWALINDEKEFGITVHYVDDGIDTGDIILQKSYAISDQDNYKTLLERSYDYCADVLYDALKLILTNKTETIKQKDIHPVGMYCGKRSEGDEKLVWSQTSREVFNFVRAICKPGPMALTYNNGHKVLINKVTEVPLAPIYKGTPGQVIGKSFEGVVVKTLDSFILIDEYYSDVTLKVGDRLI